MGKTAPILAPWEHQREFLEALKRVRAQGKKRALFVMAPGLGKTYASAFGIKSLVRGHHGLRVLFLAHQNDILDQALTPYRHVLGSHRTYGSWNGEAKDTQADVLFASFQTMYLELIAKDESEARLFAPDDFDYIVVDESHHGQAPTYKPVIEYFNPKFLLGMTATPNRADLKDIRDIFGDEIYTLDLATALAAGLLAKVDYRVLTDEIVREEKISVPPHRLGIEQLNRVFFSRQRDREAARIILAKAAEISHPRILIFTASIVHAEKFAKRIPGAVAVHSDLVRGERRLRMTMLRSGLVGTAVTVDQFNEGIDWPEANIIVFLRSTQSERIFFQQLGRGLRKTAGKKHVLVLDFVANCQRLMFLDRLRKSLVERVSKKSAAREPSANERAPPAVDWGSIVFEERPERILDLLRTMKAGLSNDILLAYLRKFYETHGRAPMSSDLRPKFGMPARTTYIKYFGSIGAALEMADIPVGAMTIMSRASSIVKKMTNEQMLELLRQFTREQKRPPTTKDCDPKHGLPSFGTIHNRFGGLKKALHVAGIVREPSESQLLDALRAFYKQHGRAPFQRECDPKRGLPSIWRYQKRFGDMAYAVWKAGLGPEPRVWRSKPRPKVNTNDSILVALRRWYNNHHRLPKVRDMTKYPDLVSWPTLKRRFGSPREAFRQAGLLDEKK